MFTRANRIIILLYIILIAGMVYTDPVLAGIGVHPTITELEVAPGRAKTGSFRVANAGEEIVLVKVQPEDWLKVRIGKSPVDVGDWLFMDEAEFELGPAEVKNIGYQIVAPEGIEGELVAMVFFASAVPSAGNVNITGRFGVALYAGIEGTEIVDASIDGIETSDTGAVILVKNQGNVHLRPSGRVLIKDAEGSLVKEVKVSYKAVIFAGGSHKYPVDLGLEELSLGEYTIEAVFDTGTIYEKNKTFRKVISLYME